MGREKEGVKSRVLRMEVESFGSRAVKGCKPLLSIWPMIERI
jgi:hypothetical protein